MLSVHCISWYLQLRGCWMDSWRHKGRSSLSSQSHMWLGSTWNWNSDTIHSEERICLWYYDMKEVRTATWMNADKIKKSHLSRRRDGAFYKRWAVTRDHDKHWGIKYVEATATIEHTDELSVWRIHPDWQEQVEWHSSRCWWSQKRVSFSENLKEFDVCTTSTTWSTGWWSSPLEFSVTNVTTWFRTRKYTNFLRFSMAGLYTQKKRQTQISALRRLERQSLVCQCHPKSLRRRFDWPWVVESL